MDLEAQRERAQQVAYQFSWRLVLRRASLRSLLFGGIAIGIGILIGAETILGLILILAGSFLFVAGVVNLIWHAPSGMLLQGLASLVIVLLEGGMFLTALAAGRFSWVAGAYAVIQGAFAIKCLKEYRAVRDSAATVPTTAADFQSLASLTKELNEGRARDADDVIAFQSVDFLSDRRNWRAQLTGEVAILTDRDRTTIQFLHREEFQIVIRRKEFFGRRFKADFFWEGVHLKGTISPTSYAKYVEWQQESNESPA